MRFYAAYGFMEFDPPRRLRSKQGFGGTVELPITYVEGLSHRGARLGPYGIALLKACSDAMRRCSLYPLLRSSTGSPRGLAPSPRSASTSAARCSAPFPNWSRKSAFTTRRTQARADCEAWAGVGGTVQPGELAEGSFPIVPSHLAKVSYPWRLEQSHAMLIGTTGMGKTVALSDMIEEARARGQRAVIFDLTGAFIEHFYDSSRDVILNPFDARCPHVERVRRVPRRGRVFTRRPKRLCRMTAAEPSSSGCSPHGSCSSKCA
jgi:hypothetical protein